MLAKGPLLSQRCVLKRQGQSAIGGKNPWRKGEKDTVRELDQANLALFIFCFKNPLPGPSFPPCSNFTPRHYSLSNLLILHRHLLVLFNSSSSQFLCYHSNSFGENGALQRLGLQDRVDHSLLSPRRSCGASRLSWIRQGRRTSCIER